MVQTGVFVRSLLTILFTFSSVSSHYNLQSEELLLGKEDTLLSRNKRALPPKPTSTPNGEVCYGYNSAKGRCLPLESCVLEPLKENYIKYKAYYCITTQRTVGVCCPNTIAIPDAYSEHSFSRQDSSSSKGGRRNSRSVGSELESRIRRSVADEINSCGRNGRLLSQVAANNRPVENKAWPWVVTIINADTKEHHCGGALISRYHILSASHCFFYGGATVIKDRVQVRLGEYDFKKNDDSGFSDYDIEDIILHEDYDEPTHENDIALIVLKRPARYNIYVQPVCMPATNAVYENRTAVVIGWGLTEFAGPRSSVLREVRVPVWQFAQCATNYLQTIFTTNVCAAAHEGGKDACQGDSGGPLMVQRADGRWEIIGIVSWGVQCGLKGKPGIYTQVNKYYGWLNDKQI